MTLELPRRSFLLGLGALIAAPAIVRVSSLMPVRNFSNWPLMILNYRDDVGMTWGRLDILYGHLKIDPAWSLNLNDLHSRH